MADGFSEPLTFYIRIMADLLHSPGHSLFYRLGRAEGIAVCGKIRHILMAVDITAMCMVTYHLFSPYSNIKIPIRISAKNAVPRAALTYSRRFALGMSSISTSLRASPMVGFSYNFPK